MTSPLIGLIENDISNGEVGMWPGFQKRAGLARSHVPSAFARTFPKLDLFRSKQTLSASSAQRLEGTAILTSGLMVRDLPRTQEIEEHSRREFEPLRKIALKTKHVGR